MAVVTALHPERRGRVRVELDGAPWRTFPAAAVAAAGLARGVELDRVRARVLRRTANRADALDRAAGALRHRERTSADLDAFLQRGGVAGAQRRDALNTLSRLGYVDDGRFAQRRAESLAAGGYGNDAIRLELEGRQLGAELIDAALEALPSEDERARRFAGTLAPEKAARRLAQRGFSDETIESVCGLPDPQAGA
jgi:regulatory protein